MVQRTPVDGNNVLRAQSVTLDIVNFHISAILH